MCYSVMLFRNNGVLYHTDFFFLVLCTRLITCSYNWAIRNLFRKSSPVLMYSRMFLIFSSIRLTVAGFMWRSLIHFGLSFLQRELFAYFYMQHFGLISTICWWCSVFVLFFFILYFGLHKILAVHRYLD